MFSCTVRQIVVGLLLLGGAGSSAHAAMVLRIVAEPSAEISTASRFGLLFELYDTVAGQRILANGVSVNLDLLRCPGYPSACSSQLVIDNMSTGLTSSGLVLFPNLVIDDAATDYFFAAQATGYQTGTTTVRDVIQAYALISALPDLPVSTATQFPLQVTIRRGSGSSDPVDLLADGVPVRLSLLACPGFPSTCSPSTLDPNLNEVVVNNGQASLGTEVITTPGPDRYFVTATTDGTALGDTSEVFDVVQAHLRSPDMSVLRYVDVPFAYPVEITVGPGTLAPVDSRADGVDLRLRLLSCPGFPNACSVNELNNNFANATAFNGAAMFAGLVISSPGPDRYFSMLAPTSVGIQSDVGTVFDVEIDPYVFSDGFESP